MKRRRSIPAALRRSAPFVLLVLGVVSAAACGGGNRSSQAARQTVRVTVEDFKISAPKRLRAGEVRLLTRNDGPDAHELLVVRDDGQALPLRSDGLTVDEEAIEPRLVTAVESLGAGAERAAVVHLRPGRYRLLCNVFGHYLGGMHRDLVVQ